MALHWSSRSYSFREEDAQKRMRAREQAGRRTASTEAQAGANAEAEVRQCGPRVKSALRRCSTVRPPLDYGDLLFECEGVGEGRGGAYIPCNAKTFLQAYTTASFAVLMYQNHTNTAEKCWHRTGTLIIEPGKCKMKR